MSRFVIDSCVAVKWIVPEPDSNLALELAEADVAFAAPDFIFVELTNVAWLVERRDPSCGPLDSAIEHVGRMFETVADSRKFLPEALKIARAIDHSPYDCLCLALALQLDAPLITSDAKFVRKLETTGYRGRAVLLTEWR